MGNQRISDLTPIQSGSLDKNLNVIPVVNGNETYQTTLTDLQSDLDSRTLKVSGSVGFGYDSFLPGAWSTGGALSTPRYRTPGGAGDKNAALAFGGYTYSTYVITGVTEAYDGSSWSAVNPMINPRNNLAGFGSQNSAVAVGGNDCRQPWRFSNPSLMSCTEEYNGATWTVGGALSSTPYGRNGLSAVGTQNAGLAFGGYPEYVTSQTEKYDGSAWSSAAALNSTRYNSAGAGTQNAALMFGGASANTPDYYTTCTEAYNGTTWSAQTGLSIGRYYLGGSGTQNEALAFGGYSDNCSYESCTEKWDGTAWSTDTPLSNGRYSLGSTGNSTGNSIAFGGVNWDGSGTYCMNCTEEYANGDPISITKFSFDRTTGDISAQGSFSGILNASSADVSGNLNVTSSLNVVGDTILQNKVTINDDLNVSNNVTFKNLLNSENILFNQNSFSAGETAISLTYGGWGLGTQKSALAGGTTNSAGRETCTEEYNGSTWSTGGARINASRDSVGASASTQNAGLVFGGRFVPSNACSSCTEEYDGTTWTAGGSLLIASYRIGGAGTQTSALAISTNPNSSLGNTEEYDGTTWTAASNLSYSGYGQNFRSLTGIQNAALFVNGISTIEYDGSLWSFIGGLPSTNNSFGSSSPQSVTTMAGTPDDAIAYVDDRVISTLLYKWNGSTWISDINSTNPFVIQNNITKGSGATAIGTGTSGIIVGGRCTGARTLLYNDFGYTVPFTYSDTCTTSLRNTLHVNKNIGRGAIGLKTSINSSLDTLDIKGTTLTLNSPRYNSFSIGGNLINARTYAEGTGTNSSALAVGGASSLTPTAVTISCTEEYDGITWSVGGALINSRYGAANTGTQNSSLLAGGLNPSYTLCTEEYDGSTWSESPSLLTTRHSSMITGIGTSNASMIIGSALPPGTSQLIVTEEYNGTSWSVSPVNSSRICGLGSAGYVNSALVFGKPYATINSSTEEYNGVVWSQAATTLDEYNHPTGHGLQNDALKLGGGINSSDTVTCTEQYDGTSWSNGNPLITGRCGAGSAGNTNAGIVFGGISSQTPSAILASTEEINNYSGIIPSFDSTTVNNLSGGTKLNSLSGNTSAWTTKSSLPHQRYKASATGTSNAAIVVGGCNASYPYSQLYQNDLRYNGSVWNTGNSLPYNPASPSGIVQTRCQTAVGSQNSTLVSGYSNTLINEGNAWKIGPTPPSSACNQGAAGTLYSAAYFSSTTAEFNGESWSSGGNLINNRNSTAGTGFQDSALAIGGLPTQTCTEEYNGVVWSVGGALITGKYFHGVSGTQNSALAFGSQPSGTSCLTEEYNGTSWSQTTPMNNIIDANGFDRTKGMGTPLSTLAIGTSNVQEYNTTFTTETTFEHTDTGRLVFSQISSSLDFASDSAAAAGGVPLGGIYRNGGDIKIRLV